MAQKRLKIINFYKKYGEKATKEAFGANRKVISRWCQRLKGRGGKIQALVPISTKPDKFRTSQIDCRIIAKIKELRQQHYRLGKNII